MYLNLIYPMLLMPSQKYQQWFISILIFLIVFFSYHQYIIQHYQHKIYFITKFFIILHNVQLFQIIPIFFYFYHLTMSFKWYWWCINFSHQFRLNCLSFLGYLFNIYYIYYITFYIYYVLYWNNKIQLQQYYLAWYFLCIKYLLNND